MEPCNQSCPFDRSAGRLDATFTDDLAWGSTGRRKAKALGFISLLTFQPIWIKFELALKQSKSRGLILPLFAIY